MKKILLAAALLVGVSFASSAQTKEGNRISIGFDGGAPIGDGADAYNAVVGGSIKFEAPIATSTSFTLSAGYSAFLGKTITVPVIGQYKVPSYTAIPIKAGIKYHFNEGFYAEGQLGAAIGTKSGSKVGFAYAPGIGYDFGGGVDIGVRYEGWAYRSTNPNGTTSSDGTLSQIAARLAFSF